MNKISSVLFRASIITIFIFSCPRLSAQPAGLFFQNYTTLNGLCDNYINSITQDSRGFIWIGTAEGLSRFDGGNFKNFYGSRDSRKSFINQKITNIVEYKPHHLIFCSLGKLWCMNTLDNTFYQPSSPSLGGHFNLVRHMPGGGALLSYRDTVFIVDQDLNITHQVVNPVKNIAFSGYPLNKDTLLLTNGRVHYLYSISSRRSFLFNPRSQFKENESISVFLGDEISGNIYYFNNYWNGLYQYASDGSIYKHYTTVNPNERKRLSSNSVYDLLQDNDSTLYIASLNGLNVVNTKTGIVNRYFKQFDNPNSIAGNTLTTIFKDRSGNIWIGSTEGLSKLGASNHNVEIINKLGSQNLKHEFTRIIGGVDDFLYATTLGGGTFRINRFTNAIEQIDSRMVSNAWAALPAGVLVYVAGGGERKLLSYHSRNGERSVPRFLDPYFGNADIVTLLYRDSHGDEWYSINEGGGLVRKPANGKPMEHYSKKHSIPSFTHSYLAEASEDTHGNSWFGVNKSGILLQWNFKEKEFKEMAPDSVPGVKGMSFGGVSCLYADKRGKLWVSFDGAGLFSYDINRHRARLFSIEDGLPTNYIYSIIADDQHRLWLGTTKGLVCYLPAENKFISFKKENGLPADEFGANASFFDRETNSLWIASKASILRINPDDLLQRMENRFAIFTEEVEINGKMLHNYADPDFKYDENNFQFRFTALDLDNGKDLEFAYRLRGADPDWIYGGDKRSAIYSSLAPGDYAFLIKARRKGDTGWTEISEPFSFSIAAPWWQTWWFRLLLVLAFIIVAILGVRRFVQRRLEKQKAILDRQQAVEQERTRIATDMHDDFGASLSRIKFLSEKLRLENNHPGKTNEDLGKISAFSDEMAEKMGEIVWALNRRYDSSGDLISFCRSYASEFLGDKNIALHFENSEFRETKLNGEIRRNIFLVIKESLHNIVKHAGASEVWIRISIDADLRIVIQDNGKGFELESVRRFANGVENMKKRIEGMGGNFRIENVNGTRIEIQVNTGIQQNTYR